MANGLFRYELSDLVVVDVETTGLTDACTILEIGAVNGSDSTDRFEGRAYARAGCNVDPYALKINGRERITETEGVESPDALTGRFYEWLEGTGKRVIAGGKPTFDTRFLTNELRKAKLIGDDDRFSQEEITEITKTLQGTGLNIEFANGLPLFGHHGRDLVNMAVTHDYLVRDPEWGGWEQWNKYGGMPSVDGCLVYAGIGAEPKPHRALTGALMEAEAISRILYGRRFIEDRGFADAAIPERFSTYSFAGLINIIKKT